jgi:hypothetical protein
MGTTSYRVRSSARSTEPAETHEMACSLDLPPNTTATRMRSLTPSPYGPARARPGSAETLCAADR